MKTDPKSHRKFYHIEHPILGIICVDPLCSHYNETAHAHVEEERIFYGK